MKIRITCNDSRLLVESFKFRNTRLSPIETDEACGYPLRAMHLITEYR